MREWNVKHIEDIEYEVIKTNKKVEYINLECAFDIETTSTYFSTGEKTAFMYIWQFGIKDSEHVFYGRTWDDFLNLCDDLQNHFRLDEDRLLKMYIHNLGYEFQFMKEYFEWEDVFSTAKRKPLKARCQYGIEFYDSLMLSGYALDKLADNLQNHKIEKLVGDLDYSKIRHSETVMTPQELKYCKNDIVIILYYLTEQIELYGDITKIPLTNTGRVRQFVRHECYYTNTNHRKSSGAKYQRYSKLMGDLQIGQNDYDSLKRGFMGGYTHANANHVDKVHEDVTSIDFTSSYPAVMLAEKFPMSKAIPTQVTEEKPFSWYRKRFGLVFDIKFTNITSTLYYENYISESKCITQKKAQINNGRIFCADEITMTLTDVDLEIIEQTYTWDNAQITNVFRYHMQYLPKDFVKSIIKLYADKTELKDVEGEEVNYNLSKGMLNSTYGMTVTDIIRDDIEYDTEWTSTPADKSEQLEKYNKSKSRFLYYAWGVFITAYARRNLWTGIVNMGDDYIYSDTDSIKFLNHDKHKNYIENYNRIIIDKLKDMCKYHKLDYETLEPKTVEGIKKPIGVWDLDGKYKRFKTLGAKRYLVEFESGKMELTVAGLSKKNGLEYMQRVSKTNTKTFEMFNDELYIPAHETGKSTHTYIETPAEFFIQDYNGKDGYVKTRSSLHLEQTEFTLSLSRIYIQFIERLNAGELYVGEMEM